MLEKWAGQKWRYENNNQVLNPFLGRKKWDILSFYAAENDYLSLTDIARKREGFEPITIIRSWLRNASTLLYLEAWENMHNPNFKLSRMDQIKIQAFEGRDMISPKKFIEQTGAIGIVSKAGRYGGTYGHVDIAFEFASWVDPVFKLFIYKDYQRLRSEEAQRQRIEWNAGRELARLNYPIQTAAIQETTGSIQEKKKGGIYASEADLINKIVFGMTAKEWRAQNPDIKGNIRDHATTAQNTILGNLESFNAELIRKGASLEAREKALGDMAAFQIEILNKKYLK